MEKPDTQPDLTARIDEQLAATEGHTPAPWTYELDSICHGYEYRDGKHVATWIATVDHENREDYADDGYHSSSPQADRDAALIASAPTLRALLVEARAQLAAQAEALARVRGALGAVLDEAYDGQHSYRVDLSTLRAAYETLGAQL